MYIHGDANLLQYILNKILQKQQKSYPAVGMSREVYGEIGDIFVSPELKESCKHLASLTYLLSSPTLKLVCFSELFLLLFYNFSWGKYEL